MNINKITRCKSIIYSKCRQDGTQTFSMLVNISHRTTSLILSHECIFTLIIKCSVCHHKIIKCDFR